MGLRELADVAGIVAASSAVAGLIAGYLRWLRRRRARMAEIERFGQRLLRSALAARPMPTLRGFLSREQELARFGQLVSAGRGVIWVTGPSLAGKTWFVSHYVLSSGLGESWLRFQMRRDVDAEALLEAANAVLRGKGEFGLDAPSHSQKLLIADRAGALINALSRQKLVLFLDSYEQVEGKKDMDDLVRAAQDRPEGTVMVVATRVLPGWADREAEVALGGLTEEAGRNLLEQAGAPKDTLDTLHAAANGIPGVLTLAGALAGEQGVKVVAQHLARARRQAGEKLFKETFRAGSVPMRRIWMGLSMVPGPLARDAAEKICEIDNFEEAWAELAHRGLLDEQDELAELHLIARAVGLDRLPSRRAWEKLCGRRLAEYYAEFAEAEDDYRATIEAELENVLYAALLAYRCREWGVLWRLGFTLDALLDASGRWRAREGLLRLCYEGGREAKDRERKQHFAHALGSVSERYGEAERAQRWYRESLLLAREVGGRSAEAKALHSLGSLSAFRGDLDAAERLYRESIKIARDMSLQTDVAETLQRLAAVAKDRGNLRESERDYQKSLELAREVSADRLQASALHGLGTVAAADGDIAAAEARYRESLVIARNSQDRAVEGAALRELGAMALARGDPEVAAQNCEESLAIARETGDLSSEWKAWHGLGDIALGGGNLEEAQRLYEQCLVQVREVEERPGEARTLAALARLAERQGDLRLAADRMKKALGLAEEMGLAESGEVRDELDRLRRAMGLGQQQKPRPAQ